MATLFSHLNVCYLVGFATTTAGVVTIIAAFIANSDVNVQICYSVVFGFCIGEYLTLDEFTGCNYFFFPFSILKCSATDSVRKVVRARQVNECFRIICSCDRHRITIWNAHSIDAVGKDWIIFGDLCCLWHFVHFKWTAVRFGLLREFVATTKKIANNYLVKRFLTSSPDHLRIE